MMPVSIPEGRQAMATTRTPGITVDANGNRIINIHDLFFS